MARFSPWLLLTGPKKHYVAFARLSQGGTNHCQPDQLKGCAPERLNNYEEKPWPRYPARPLDGPTATGWHPEEEGPWRMVRIDVTDWSNRLDDCKWYWRRQQVLLWEASSGAKKAERFQLDVWIRGSPMHWRGINIKNVEFPSLQSYKKEAEGGHRILQMSEADNAGCVSPSQDSSVEKWG